MPFSRPKLPVAFKRPNGVAGSSDVGGEGSEQASHRLESTERPVIDVAFGRRRGIDVLIRNPPVRLDPSCGGTPIVWTARAVLTEIGGRSDLVATNASLLAMAVRAVAADAQRSGLPPAPGDGEDHGLFAAVAVHARFVADDRFLETVKGSVRRVGLEASQLLLSVAADDELEAVWPALQRLRSHGVRIALEQAHRPTPDDEDRMHLLPFDLVRIDVAQALRDDGEGGLTPTSTLRGLVANERRVWVEGVADPAGLEALQAARVELASGPEFDLLPTVVDAAGEHSPVGHRPGRR